MKKDEKKLTRNFKNVIIEKQDTNKLTITKREFPVFEEFDKKKLVGIAQVSRSETAIEAHIRVRTHAGTYYPSIMYKVIKAREKKNVESDTAVHKIDLIKGEMLCIGICSKPNVDSSIPPIVIQ